MCVPLMGFAWCVQSGVRTYTDSYPLLLLLQCCQPIDAASNRDWESNGSAAAWNWQTCPLLLASLYTPQSENLWSLLLLGISLDRPPTHCITVQGAMLFYPNGGSSKRPQESATVGGIIPRWPGMIRCPLNGHSPS